jgi:hypothetical protein
MKPNTITKRLAHCYPSSEHAQEFGAAGYYVECRVHNIEGSGQWKTYPDRSAYAGMVYPSILDPELAKVFDEANGIECMDEPYIRWVLANRATCRRQQR